MTRAPTCATALSAMVKRIWATGPVPTSTASKASMLYALRSSAHYLLGGLISTHAILSWWEVWIRQPTRRADSVAAAARDANLDVHADRLIFPDTIVLFVHAAVARLIELAQRMPGAISEIRRATGTIEPFLDQGPHPMGRVELIEELEGRITPPAAGAPTICVLDTGVAAAHPLIVPALAGAWAYDDRWGADDHEAHGGHGTAMVGLVLYGDLEGPVNDQRQIQLSHAVESMKFLPPRGFPVTEPARYGFVIQGAVAQVEIERANVLRSFCVATRHHRISRRSGRRVGAARSTNCAPVRCRANG